MRGILEQGSSAVTVSDVLKWDSNSGNAAFSAVNDLINLVHDTNSDTLILAQRIPHAWTGEAADSCSTQLANSARALNYETDFYSHLALTSMRALIDHIRQCCDEMRQIVDEVNRSQFGLTIGEDGEVKVEKSPREIIAEYGDESVWYTAHSVAEHLTRAAQRVLHSVSEQPPLINPATIQVGQQFLL